jgi:hypothetical protein
MAAWPSLPDVRKFLRIEGTADDAVIDTARKAAISYGIHKLGQEPTGLWTYPEDTTTLPDNAYQACLMHAARLYRRRDSVDGTISWGDMGAMRVGRVDPDVEALYGVIAPIVFG